MKSEKRKVKSEKYKKTAPQEFGLVCFGSPSNSLIRKDEPVMTRSAEASAKHLHMHDEVIWGSIVSLCETEIAKAISPLGQKNESIRFHFGSPKGNRTPDSAVRGRRLNRLTMGP